MDAVLIKIIDAKSRKPGRLNEKRHKSVLHVSTRNSVFLMN
jgi:hypothetical protein